MPAQPVARRHVVGARSRDEAPIVGRMVHAPQMHQLVDEDVIAHRRWHEHEPPVQADVPIAPAGSPSCTLVPDADARHEKTVLRGELQQPGR